VEPDTKSNEEIRSLVRDRYGAIAREAGSCCAPSCCGPETAPAGLNVIGRAYEGVMGRFEEADLNLGCGVPTQYAALKPGETVLDLDSGAGNDVFIGRHEVGARGVL
jgi:arsenite methyltransferase